MKVNYKKIFKKINPKLTIEYLKYKEERLAKKKLIGVEPKKVIKIITTKNNIKLLLIPENKTGEIKESLSRGTLEEFKGNDLKLPTASITLIKNFVKKMRTKKLIKRKEKIHVIYTGIGWKKRILIRGIAQSKLKIQSITQIIKKKHNGCVNKRKRRL